MSFQLCQPSATGLSGRSRILFLILAHRDLKRFQALPKSVPSAGPFVWQHSPWLPSSLPTAKCWLLESSSNCPRLLLGTISLTLAPGLSVLTPGQLQPAATLPVTQQSLIACCPEHPSSCSHLMSLNEASSQPHSTKKLNSGWGAPSLLYCEFPTCLLTPEATGLRVGSVHPPHPRTVAPYHVLVEQVLLTTPLSF